MSNIHLILQGKGGAGKSYVAVLLAQYLQSKNREILCADTDPVNATFTKYASLNVASVKIAENGNIIQRKFDPLMETILAVDKDCVIDNGAATFMPLTKYLHENNICQIMSEAGKKVYIHTVLNAGQAQCDTYNGMVELFTKVNGFAKIVVWENEKEGKIEFERGHRITADKSFREADKAGKIAGVVNIIDRRQSDTFVGDVAQMTGNSMTLADVMDSPDFNYFAKLRLRTVINDVFAELDKVNW